MLNGNVFVTKLIGSVRFAEVDLQNISKACKSLIRRLFDEQEIPVLRMLPDRGTVFSGRTENHEYELYLSLKNIKRSRTKVRHSQSNGIYERLHRTMKEELYAITFRKKIYGDLE